MRWPHDLGFIVPTALSGTIRAQDNKATATAPKRAAPGRVALTFQNDTPYEVGVYRASASGSTKLTLVATVSPKMSAKLSWAAGSKVYLDAPIAFRERTATGAGTLRMTEEGGGDYTRAKP